MKYFTTDIEAVDVNENTITWNPIPKDDKDFLTGVEPDVSINCNGDVAIISRSVGREVRAKLGKVDGSGKKIIWADVSTELTTTGINPTISLNKHGQIVEIHQNLFKQLSISCGCIKQGNKGKAIDWDPGRKSIHYGEYPVIVLSDQGVVLEMHCTPVGFSLFYTQGEFRALSS